jgi:hypothetical protein
VSTIINEDKNEVRRYLLGQLEGADEEQLELRLLTDAAFGEEFDTVVDEITDQYVGNELAGEERKRVEQYFLRSPQRQIKGQLATELLQRAELERGNGHAAAAAIPSKPGFFELIRLFWNNQSFALRTATTIATILIVVGIAFLMWPRNPASGTYALVSLQISTGDRASGAETKTVRLAGNAGIRIALTLPDQATEPKSYRVELVDGQERSRDLPAERNAQSLLVTIPANEITPGAYIIRLHAVNPDGTEQRVRGSYYLNVE